MRCCIGASTTEPRGAVSFRFLHEPLFSTPGRGSQTLEQYSTWGQTKPLWALAFKVDEFTRTLPHVTSIRDSIRLGTFHPWPVACRTPKKFSDSYRDFCNPHGFKRVSGYYPTRPKILWEHALFCIVKPRSPSVAELIVLGQWDT